jgi:benzoate/toluate 1,2-dioxygenase subunit alpha
MATPDDTVTYEDSQRGFASGLVQWQQGTSRGTATMQERADQHARELGVTPATSMHGPFSMSDEPVYHAMYLAWQRQPGAGGKE